MSRSTIWARRTSSETLPRFLQFLFFRSLVSYSQEERIESRKHEAHNYARHLVPFASRLNFELDLLSGLKDLPGSRNPPAWLAENSDYPKPIRLDMRKGLARG